MNKNKICLLIITIIISNFVFAQKDSSQTKYCTLKVAGSSPFKVISVGYDYQMANDLSSNIPTSKTPTNSALGTTEKNAIQSNQGLRIAANFPVISKSKWLVIASLSYLENKYNFSDTPINPFPKTLNDNGLRSIDAGFAIFKPLNNHLFLLNQTNFDLNGDYNLHSFQPLSTVKISSAFLFGWKPLDREEFAIGICRSYRGGEQSILPVLLYNYTFPNHKWGIESLLPARAAVRYTVNAKNLLLAGFVVEGNSYYLGNLMKSNPTIPYQALELRRSEIRARITYECSIYKFIWLSLQVGYRINSKFDIDNGDFYRTINNKPYVMEDKLTNPLYSTISIHLVAP